MSRGTVSWGTDHYDAAADADRWLLRSPRSGPASTEAVRLDRRFVETVADQLTALPFATWNFGDSVAFDALVEATDRTGEQRWAAFCRGWGRAWATRSQPFARLDCTVPGRALVRVAERFSDHLLMAELERLADYLMARPRIGELYETWQEAPLIPPYGDPDTSREDRELLTSPPPCVCVDCLHFDPPFLVRLGRATGAPSRVEAGTEQALAYVSALQRPDGLFDHFLLAGRPGTFGPGWGRGQGWALLGLLDVVEDHPSGREAEAVRRLARSAEELVRAMVALQRPDGHWPVVVTEPTSGDEYSTTAFMVAGFRRAARLAVVADVVVAEALARAEAALAAAFDDDGSLREVSAAVYASTVPSHYIHVPRGFVVPWGQGPALLALLEAVGADPSNGGPS